MENGWFPRFNLLGEVASGFGRVEFQGRVLLEPGFAPRWFDTTTLVAGGEGDYLYWLSKHGGEVYRVKDAAGTDVKPPYQVYGAGGGQWSIPTEGESPEGHWREIGVEHDLADGKRLTLREYRGQNHNRSVWYDGQPLSEHRFLGSARAFAGYVVWVEFARPSVIRGWRGHGVEDLATRARNSDGDVLSENNPIPILTDEGPWLSFATSVDIRVRPWNSTLGYIIATGEDRNINHDAIALGRTIRLTWQDTKGNRSYRAISLDEPRVDVRTQPATPPTPEPEPEPEPEPMPTISIPNRFDVIQRIDAEHPHLVQQNTRETVTEFMWRAGTALHAADPGFGLLSKSEAENHIVINGQRVSVDAVTYRKYDVTSDRVVDLLRSAGDGPGKGGIAWGDDDRKPDNVWVQPVPFPDSSEPVPDPGTNEPDTGPPLPDDAELRLALLDVQDKIQELTESQQQLAQFVYDNLAGLPSRVGALEGTPPAAFDPNQYKAEGEVKLLWWNNTVTLPIVKK